MSAINNRIYVGSITTPLFYFENDEIMEVTFDKCVDVISEELTIDVLKLKVEHFPTTTSNLRLLPYGTPVWWYVGNDLKAKFYSESIEREEQHYYIVNCISAIGLLDKQYYHGGIYSGETCGDVLEELIDNAVPFTVSEEVSETKIYGYLPYASKRECLHGIIYAEGISILKDANGDMFFTYAEVPSTPATIPQDRIFLKGKIKYPAIPSKIELVEHSYQYVDTIERITLFDNSDGNSVTGQTIYFDTAPIVPDSLEASEGLTINEKNANFASLTGKGVLTGIPYYDKQTTISRNYSGGQPYTKRITDRTLVTIANSEYVADRLLSYYTSSENLEADIKIQNETCGNVYSFINKYSENVTAFLARIKGNVSSFIKGSCELIAGYYPEKHGNNYSYYVEAKNPCDIVVPNGCKRLRLIIIAGGDGGSSGTRSKPPHLDDTYTSSEGGKGGLAGDAGDGGRIKEVIINNPEAGNYHCRIGIRGKGGIVSTSEETKNAGTKGQATSVVRPNGTVISSNDTGSYISKYGIMNVMNGKVYGKKGKDGVKGGDGGKGSLTESDSGEDVYYDGILYKGGKGKIGISVPFNHSNKSANFGSAGGEGAMAFGDGKEPTDVKNINHIDETVQRNAEVYEEITAYFSFIDRSDVYVPEKQIENGNGGDAGCGGAGEGGSTPVQNLYEDYYTSANKIYHLVSGGGGAGPWGGSQPVRYGTRGYDGGSGVVIAYADVPLEIVNELKLPTPHITPITQESSEYNTILIENCVIGQKYIVERRLINWPVQMYRGDAFDEYEQQNYHTWRDRMQVTATAEVLQFTDTSLLPSSQSNIYSTYKYRVYAQGDEEHGESNYSNECITGAGKPQMPSFTFEGAYPVWWENEFITLLRLDEKFTDREAKVRFERKEKESLTWKLVQSTDATEEVYGFYVGNIKKGMSYNWRAWSVKTDYIGSNYTNTLLVEIPAEITNKLISSQIFLEFKRQTPDETKDSMIIYVCRCDSRPISHEIQEKIGDGEWRTIGTVPYYEGNKRIWYNVTRSHPGGYQQGVTYSYRIKEKNADYEDSDFSNIVSHTVE